MHIEIRIKKSDQSDALIKWLNSPIASEHLNGKDNPRKKATFWNLALSAGTRFDDTLWTVEGDYHLYKDSMFGFEPDMDLMAKVCGPKGILAKLRVHISYYHSGQDGFGYAEFLNGYKIASWNSNCDRPEFLKIISKDIDNIGKLMEPDRLFPEGYERDLDRKHDYVDQVLPTGEVKRYLYHNSMVSKSIKDGVPEEKIDCEIRCYYKVCDFNMLSESFEHVGRLFSHSTYYLCKGLKYCIDGDGNVQMGKVFHAHERVMARVKRKNTIKAFEEDCLSRETWEAIDQGQKTETEEEIAAINAGPPFNDEPSEEPSEKALESEVAS